jgi:predicted nucleic acid-binding Zn ribbon protein
MGGTPVPIGGALQESLRAQGLGFLMHEQKLREQWARVLGDKAAQVAGLESLKDFVLHVKVEGAVWRNELHYQLDAIRQRANEVLGADIVREVRLR